MNSWCVCVPSTHKIQKLVSDKKEIEQRVRQNQYQVLQDNNIIIII